MSEKHKDLKNEAGEIVIEEELANQRYTDCGVDAEDGQETPAEGEDPSGDGVEIIVEDGDDNKSDSHRSQKKQKRQKKHGNNELAELLKKKNDLLQNMEKRLRKVEEDSKIKEDKVLRMAAEFENYKKRTRREWDLHQKKANADLLSGILGVLDDFERAFDAAEGEGDHFRTGIRMIHAQLMDVLKRAGLLEIEAAGEVFDPQFHEAMGESPSSEVQPGTVLHVVQKGYMLHDQLLRPARVIVARQEEQESGE
ncbi:MAG TPA: nucleotide exchange factor GrpE [Candidatus Krumholzibacterium sp.]|nr:nucleotide exchange factor GrpE [Candidatus Krumholzibacterium sp.]